LQNQQTGETQAKLLEIENIEDIQQEISDTEEILSMLMPNQLKKPSMHFLEVEDIRSLRVQAEPPKTEAQIEREQLEEVIRADEESKKWEKVTDEQREKTIRCLFKILDY